MNSISVRPSHHTPVLTGIDPGTGFEVDDDPYDEHIPEFVKRTRAKGASDSAPRVAFSETLPPNLVNLAEGTYDAPRHAAEIKAQLKKLSAGLEPGVQGKYLKLYFTKMISARQLEILHLGVGDHAPHLDPNAPGLTTGTLEDQKRIRIVWQFPVPKSGDLHPEEVRLADGRLAAAWLTSEEEGCRAEVEAFEKRTNQAVDFLGGNRAALETGWKRLYRGLEHRYHSYFRGIKEGMANPRSNGRVGANFLVTGLAITTTLYALFYAVQYTITMQEIKKQHHRKDQDLMPTLPPAYQTAAAGGSNGMYA